MKLPDDILEVVIILRSLGGSSCIVGGFVRDAILGMPSKDVDFVTSTPYDHLAAAFKEAGWTVKETGKRFLVLMVSKGGRSYEIANYRKDGVYLDGRRPETCEIGTMLEDAVRRDFTINALYYNLTTHEIEDPTGQGLEDARQRLLRFIGSPMMRIKEDSLRVFRFYRFLETKSLYADRVSLKAVRRTFSGAIASSHPDRIRKELENMIHKERL